MKNLTYIFAATLFMVACNNEEISSLQDGKNLEVKFTSNLTGYDSQVVSRVNGTSFDQGDEVAIWASSEGAAPFTGKKVLTAGEDGKLSSTETFTYKDDKEVSFSALYPASLCDGTDQSDITLTTQTDDNGYQTLQDLLYATGKGSAGSPTVNLPFYHKGVKIDVAVKQGDGINLTDAEVFVKAKSGGVFSFANSSITPKETTATDIKIPLAVVKDFTNDVNYGSTIVAPQTLEGGCIGIKLQGEEATKYLSYSKIELKEGYRYCFHIDTRKNDAGNVVISIDSQVNETPWKVSEVTTGEVVVDKLPVNQFGDELIVNGNFDTDNLISFSCFDNVKIERIQESDGNWILKVTNEKVYANDWEAQFFVSFSPVVSLGETYAYNLKIKSDADCNVSTQAHTSPGSYIHWTMLGTNLNFKTEWSEIKGEITITEEMVGAGTIAFNIGLTATNYYLDDFSFRKVINNE